MASASSIPFTDLTLTTNETWDSFVQRATKQCTPASPPSKRLRPSELQQIVELTLSSVLRSMLPSMVMSSSQLPLPCTFLDGCDCSQLPARCVKGLRDSTRGGVFPCMDTETFIVPGTADHVMWVQQGEYGFCVHTGAAPTIVASPDATSCVVIAVRATVAEVDGPGDQRGTTVLAMTHLDSSGRNALAVLSDMIERMVVPALLAAKGAIAEGESITVDMEWYLVGGVRDAKHTLPLLGDVFYFFAACLPQQVTTTTRTEEDGFVGGVAQLRHRLRLDGFCLWTMNTVALDKKRDRCCVWGLQVDAATGYCAPCQVKVGSRTHAHAALRELQCGSYRPISAMFPPRESDVPPFHMSCMQLRTAPAIGGKGTMITLRFVDFVKLRGASHGTEESTKDTIPIIVPCVLWDRSVDPKQFADEDFMTMSTTPYTEPPDFATGIRRKMALSRTFSPSQIFGEGTSQCGILFA